MTVTSGKLNFQFRSAEQEPHSDHVWTVKNEGCIAEYVAQPLASHWIRIATIVLYVVVKN